MLLLSADVEPFYNGHPLNVNTSACLFMYLQRPFVCLMSAYGIPFALSVLDQPAKCHRIKSSITSAKSLVFCGRHNQKGQHTKNMHKWSGQCRLRKCGSHKQLMELSVCSALIWRYDDATGEFAAHRRTSIIDDNASIVSSVNGIHGGRSWVHRKYAYAFIKMVLLAVVLVFFFAATFEFGRSADCSKWPENNINRHT